MLGADPGRLARARSLRTLLAAATLVATFGEIHLPHALVLSLEIGGEETVAVDARHARQEAHLESSEIAVRSHCPACLLQRQPLDRAGIESGTPVLRLAGQRPAAGPRWTAADAARGPCSPRGPPLA